MKSGVTQFRYQARERNGASVEGTVDAQDRGEALEILSRRGLFPSRLEACADATAPVNGAPDTAPRSEPPAVRDARARAAPVETPVATERPGHATTAGPEKNPRQSAPPHGRVRRKEVTAFTREMATLLAAAIPIPAALESLSEEEESPAFREVLTSLLSLVRRGNSLSEAMQGYPMIFPGFYTSIVEVGEEAGALDKVLGDLADLLEREDEVRAEVVGAVAYPCFVLCLGIVTTFVLLAFVLPRLFDMLQGMADVLPLPTVILLHISTFFNEYWGRVLCVSAAFLLLARWFGRSPQGSSLLDELKLRLPVLGPVFRASALARFARMLGILLRSGVSLLPGLETVRHTVGNQFVAEHLRRVGEATRGGDALASGLRRSELFAPTLVKMIAVGEDTGQLDDMLLRVATIQERQLREKSRTLISLLAPALILVVGGLIGFIVIALLLPIFQMSQAIQ